MDRKTQIAHPACGTQVIIAAEYLVREQREPRDPAEAVAGVASVETPCRSATPLWTVNTRAAWSAADASASAFASPVASNNRSLTTPMPSAP